MKVLRDADKKGQLEIAKEWQEIDLDLVEEELNKSKGFSAKTAVLARKYPSLNIFLLGKLNQYEKLKKYILECKAYETANFNKYCLYIHGYLIPSLQNQRLNGLIKHGK